MLREKTQCKAVNDPGYIYMQYAYCLCESLCKNFLLILYLVGNDVIF